MKKNKKKKKKKQEEYKKVQNEKYLFLKTQITKHSNNIPFPNKIIKNEYINTYSFFDMKISTFKKNRNVFNFIKGDNDSKLIGAKKIILLPNLEQKKILLESFEAYRIMFNETNRFIKERYFNGEKTILSFKTLRTYYLKSYKDNLMKKYKVYSHTLDGAIKLACASYKSAITNLKNGHIRRFRIRYLKKKKDSHIIDIEKVYIKSNTIFPLYIKGDMKNTQNVDYLHIDKDCKIQYNRNKDIFTLLVPEDLNNQNKKRKKEYISIDPGLRTFLTCISDNQVIEIGSNIGKELGNINRRIEKYDKIENKKIRDRYKTLLREKIKNRVRDMHYKIINFLQKYKNIFIGKWSTKSIISKKSSVLNKEQKKLAQNISYYIFLQRLKHKGKINENNVVITEENYTTKLCSKCGNKKNIGRSKIYECRKCNLKLDRDINSARNIFMKNIQ